MKKYVLTLILVANSISLLGSSVDNTEETLKELKSIVMHALIEDEDSSADLKAFVKEHKQFIEGNPETILDMPFLSEQNFRTGIETILHGELFPQKKEIISTIFPSLELPNEPSQHKDEIVAGYLEWCLQGKFPYKLLEYAYQKNPIDVDVTSCSYVRRDNRRPLYANLGEVLFYEEDKAYGEINGSLKTRNKVRQLVSPSRMPLKSSRFYPESLYNLIDACLVQHEPLSALERFVDNNPFQFRKYKELGGLKALREFLGLKNPVLYDIEPLLRILEVNLEIDPWTAVPIEEIEEIGGKQVAGAIIDALKEDVAGPKSIKAQFLYKKFPIDVDTFSGFSEGQTLGDEIDSMLVSNPRFLDLSNIVNVGRKNKPLTKMQEREFINLVFECLAAEQDDPILEKLKILGSQFKMRKETVDTIQIELNLSGFMSKYSFKSFIEAFSPHLFPNKKFVMQHAFKSAFLKSTKHDDTSDQKEMLGLIRKGVDMPEFVPLVRRGLVNYRKAYPLAEELDLNGITCGETTLAKYLNEHRELPQYTEYKQSFPKSFVPAQLPAPKNDVDKPKEIEKPMATWKKLALVGAAGVVSFVVYKYMKKSKQPAATQVR